MFTVVSLPITITALYASLLALLMLVLAGAVVYFRVRRDTLLGDDGSALFNSVIRSHANLVEYAPITLLLMLIAELNSVNGLFLHGVGVVFTLGRLAHAYGMLRAEGGMHAGRAAGTLTSWLAMAALAITNLLCAGEVI